VEIHGWLFNDHFIAILLLNVPVKKFQKLVNEIIVQDMDTSLHGCFLTDTV